MDTKKDKKKAKIDKKVLLEAWELMCTARDLTNIYEENFKFTSKYVHATSRGHEAVQLALGLQLKKQDWLSAYYRDDSILLGIGMQPYDLMLQLMAKRDDPFSAGRTYYSHPALRDDDKPKIPHQSSATGMQAIEQSGKNVAMIITGLKAEFSKKATSRVTFTCNDGLKYSEGLKQAIEKGEAVEIEGRAEGRDATGEVVSIFYVTWSFKERE